MRLKVGDLAKRTGLTVRTLHHYDEIGLLVPSARSDAGHRLYSAADIARLHAIQALRGFGLPLGEIQKVLASDSEPLPTIIDRQLHQLREEIAKTTELSTRLLMLRESLIENAQPEMGEWLRTLEIMSAYSRHFSAFDIKQIRKRWKDLKKEWDALIKEIDTAMKQCLPVSDVLVQSLAHRWMTLSLEWMNGDSSLLKKWDEMYRHEPAVQGRHGVGPEFLNFINGAIKLRQEALERHLSPEELQQFMPVPQQEWNDLEERVTKLIEEGESPHAPGAQRLAMHWMSLMDRVTGGNQLILSKLLAAIQKEPILQSSGPLSIEARNFLKSAWKKTS